MRASIGTGVVLMAVGAVLAFAVRPPVEVQRYVDLLDFGLILVWSGILLLIMQVVVHRPPRRRVVRSPRQPTAFEDPWDTRDVHRPGYAGETSRLPTVRGKENGR